MQLKKISNLQITLIILSVIAFYRIYVLYTLPYHFYFDEAYYWEWSKRFEFGYYSKPPMVAWVISLFTSFCGESEFCIKLPSVILYFLSSIFIYFTARRLYDEKTAFFSAIAFFTLPSVFLSSVIISTDAVFLFWWSLSLWLFVLSVKDDRLYLWFLLGIAGGFGLLSKYTMILFLVSALFYLLSVKREVFFKKGFYLSLVVAFLIFLPNLWWNFQNGFVTFLHTKDNADIQGKLFHLNTLFEFLGSQFGVFGPVFFAVLLYMLFSFKRYKDDENYLLLWWFVTPLFALITLLSYISRAHANWAAPVYISASVLVVWYLVSRQKMLLLKTGIIINILLGLVIYNFDAITSILHIELNAKNDPCKKTRGWDRAGEKIGKIVKGYDLKLVFDDRMSMSELIYYIKPHPFDALFWNPSKKTDNYFALTTNMNRYKNRDFLFITKQKREDIKRYFEKVTLIKVVKIPVHKDYVLRYYIFFVKNFKGY